MFFFLFDSYSKDELKECFTKTSFVAVIGKLFKTSIIVKLPNDPLFPNTILKIKIKQEYKNTIKIALKSGREKKYHH